MSGNGVRPLSPRNREFALQVLSHVAGNVNEAPRYTIGVWEGSSMRAICHASSLAGALLALRAELEGRRQDERVTVAYPRWLEICGLVRRLEQRADTDCIAAARYLEDLQAQLLTATAQIEPASNRVTNHDPQGKTLPVPFTSLSASGLTTNGNKKSSRKVPTKKNGAER
jgi:hypothetical protein